MANISSILKVTGLATMFVWTGVILGCNSEAMRTEHSSNGAKAELIAEVDGCRIWRIDEFHEVYFARCPEGSATTQTSVTCGKNCIRPQQTVGESR